MTTRTFRTSVVFAAIVVLATSSGCVGVVQRVEGWCYGLSIRAQQHHELANVRQDTRVALAEQEQEALRLAAERDVEAARLDAERRRLEIEFCQARQEALQRQLQRNVIETVESKVAFPVEQTLQVGELEVDVEALQALIKQREQEAQQRPPEQEAQKRQPCVCCDQPCSCGSGWVRRLCPHCRHKPCEAERDCGGPEALQRLAQEGQRRPLKPAEIPMKLPVRLSFAFQQPEMEAARIRRQPGIEQEALERFPCNRCTDPNCPGRCTQPVDFLPADARVNSLYYDEPPPSPVPSADPRIGPMPVPDAEARRPQRSMPHGITLGWLNQTVK